MRTFILFWKPGTNWFDWSTVARDIEEGMCGEDPSWVYIKPWAISDSHDIKRGDRFFIVCTQKDAPKNDMIYDYLKSTLDCYMGIGPRADKFYDLDGVCFGGFFDTDPYVDEDNANKRLVRIYLEFAVLPGLFPIINLKQLKKEFPNIDWSRHEGEYLIEGEDAERFSEMMSKWMMSSGMERSDFTNFTERDLELAHDNLFAD